MFQLIKYGKFLRFYLLAILIVLPGCASNSKQAPMVNIWPQKPKSTINYVVQKSDTLYSIAFGFGIDYRQLAQDNGISAPAYKIRLGQTLKIIPNTGEAVVPTIPPVTTTDTVIRTPGPVVVPLTTHTSVTAPSTSSVVNVSKPAPVPAPNARSIGPVKIMPVKTVSNAGIRWAWPAQGKIIGLFAVDSLNKGIDIAGKAGSPIVAAASGRVVYAGSGLRGYGQLIIIKNSDDFLSAYAHNQKLLVVEGQKVKVGQVIATMGSSEAQRVMLHFEIRRTGKPVDPLAFLPSH